MSRRWYLWFQDDDGGTIAVHGPYVERAGAVAAMAVLCEAEGRAMAGFDLDAPVDALRMAAFWQKVRVVDLDPEELAALR